MTTEMRQKLSTFIKVAVAAGLIYWLIKSGRLDIEQVVRLFQPFYLAVGICLVLTNILINNMRWYVLLRARDFQLSVWESIKLTFIGLFFNIAMPGGVGGDLVKGYYLVRDHQERKVDAAVTILMDRIVGFFGMVVLSGIALTANWESAFSRPEMAPLNFGIVSLFTLFLIIFAVGLSGRTMRFFQRLYKRIPAGHYFEKLHSALYSYRKAKWSLAVGLIMSLISQGLAVFFFMVVGWAMGLDLSWQVYFYVVPLGMIAMAAPIAPAGIGVGQTALFALFHLYLGYDTQVGPAAITSYQIIQIALSLLGSVFYFQRKSAVPISAEVNA